MACLPGSVPVARKHSMMLGEHPCLRVRVFDDKSLIGSELANNRKFPVTRTALTHVSF